MRIANRAAAVLGDRCVICRRDGPPLCPTCAAGALPAPPGPDPPGMAAVHAAWSYEGPGRAVVLALKERGRRGCADPLAAAAAQAVWREGSAADALTFVPARRDDVRRRGFDHGALLAREVGRRLGLEVLPLLSRARPVDDQVGLSATARRENLRGAFISAPAPARIALVDDVVTTGATAAACAAALRRAGTRRVELIVACRTPATY